MVSVASKSVDTFCSVSGNSDILLLVSRDRRSAENILLASDVGFWTLSDRSAKCFLNERYSALSVSCVQRIQHCHHRQTQYIAVVLQAISLAWVIVSPDHHHELPWIEATKKPVWSESQTPENRYKMKLERQNQWMGVACPQPDYGNTHGMFNRERVHFEKRNLLQWS